jgi:hypothetical protein
VFVLSSPYYLYSSDWFIVRRGEGFIFTSLTNGYIRFVCWCRGRGVFFGYETMRLPVKKQFINTIYPFTTYNGFTWWFFSWFLNFFIIYFFFQFKLTFFFFFYLRLEFYNLFWVIKKKSISLLGNIVHPLKSYYSFIHSSPHKLMWIHSNFLFLI